MMAPFKIHSIGQTSTLLECTLNTEVMHQVSYKVVCAAARVMRAIEYITMHACLLPCLPQHCRCTLVC